MFFRRKLSGRTEYLQIVKNDRVDGRPRQSVVATLGRVDELAQDGTLERLLRSGARFAHSAVVLTAYEKGEATAIATRQLGPALAFERLWRETGCKQVISALAAEREFQFDLERCCVSDCPASPVRSRLGPRSGEVAARPGRRRGRRPRSAPALPGDGLAWRRTGRPERTRHWSAHYQGSRRGAVVRPAQQPVQRAEPCLSRYHLAVLRG